MKQRVSSIELFNKNVIIVNILKLGETEREITIEKRN